MDMWISLSAQAKPMRVKTATMQVDRSAPALANVHRGALPNASSRASTTAGAASRRSDSRVRAASGWSGDRTGQGVLWRARHAGLARRAVYDEVRLESRSLEIPGDVTSSGVALRATYRSASRAMSSSKRSSSWANSVSSRVTRAVIDRSLLAPTRRARSMMAVSMSCCLRSIRPSV